MPTIGSWLALFLGLATFLPAVAEQIAFHEVPKDVVLSRLRRTAPDNRDRAAILKQLFEEAGCTGDRLEEQPVKHLKAPNVICTWPGSTDVRILVAAHSDHVSAGDGTVDDWSGASMLANLIESLRTKPRHHTFVFIGFTGEEAGLVGSHFYVKTLTGAQKSQIAAVVNLECLGLSTTAVWQSHADRQLARFAGQIAAAGKLPIQATNVDNVGLDDAMSFNGSHIPTISFHSVTQSTWPILHSREDQFKAIRVDDYYDSYRFLTAYLAYADIVLP